MKYRCGQCGEAAVVIADEDMDNPGTSPPTTVWVVCDDCGYAVPKDTADKKVLLVICKAMQKHFKLTWLCVHVTSNIQEGLEIIEKQAKAAIEAAESEV